MRITSILLLLLVLTYTNVHSNNVVAADDFLVGKSVIEITPPIPYRMSGYFSERLSTGIKDRLYAKTLVFIQGKTKGAIVFCDLIGISPKVAQKARAEAETKYGIPANNISIAATHSHTGPLYFGALRKHFHDRKVKASGTDEFEVVDYPQKLVGAIVKSIGLAHETAQAVKMQVGNASENRLSFNRRFHMKTGGVRFNPGQQNPNIVRVAGPIDPEVGLVSFTNINSSRPWGSIVAFALHLDTVGGTEYSADYPKYLQDRLRQTRGDDFVSFFGAGTCGDINHIDVKIKGRRSAQEIGTLLGETVDKKLTSLATVQKPDLAIKNTKVDALLQTYAQSEIEKCKKNMDLVDTSKLSFLDRVHTYKVTALQMRNAKSIPLEVHAFKLSKECAIVTLPGEVFVELGMAIKAASPFDTTLVIELANDAPGYIPTRKAFAEGSYETVNSRVQTGYGEQMATAAIRLLKELAAK